MDLFDCCRSSDDDTTTASTTNIHRRKKARMMDPLETDLVQELNELSVEERGKALDEIHGVDKTPEETPEFVAASMEALDTALRSGLKKKARRALDRAFFLRPSLKTDNKFKLWFLRTEYFDAKKAANRMARYFTSKLLLFGKENLARDVTLANLTQKEVEKTFRVGCHTVLPNKDSSGRLVIISDTRYWDYNDNLTMLKGVWCLLMSILKSDEVATKRGFINVCYSPECIFQNSSPATVIKGAKQTAELLMDSFPLRFASFHYCYNDPAINMFVSALQMSLSKHLRVRLRMHYGTPIEIQYSLMTFGIYCQRGGGGRHNETTTDNNDNKQDSTGNAENDCTPSSSTELQLLLLHEDKHCLERTIQIERRHAQMQKEDEARTGIILYPNPNDVLMGRGKCYHDHCGNQRYQSLVEAELDKYNDEANGSFEKVCITMNMVKTIQDSGGRFLAPVACRGWKVLDDIVARNKTAVSFRSRHSKHKNRASKV